MGTFRLFFRDRPTLAALLLAAALFLKALVPTGYMPAAANTGFIVALCSGSMPQGSTITITIPQKGADQDFSRTTADHPCAFSALGDAMAGVDFAPLLLAALAYLFVLAILRRPLTLPAIDAQIWPPSHGPPRII